MLKLFSSVSKPPAASLALRTGTSNLLSQRYKSTFIVKNGPALFKKHFGEENVGPIEEATLPKGTKLIGPSHHPYAHPDQPGVFLKKANTNNLLMIGYELDPGQTKIGFFNLLNSSKCCKANVREKFTGEFVSAADNEFYLVHHANVGPQK